MKAIRDILIVIIILVAVFGGGYYVGWLNQSPIGTQTRRDTVVMRDTLHDTVLLVQWKKVVRVDTVYFATPADTIHDVIAVPVPIEQKTYATDNYTAVIEGYCPRLVDMTIYPETQYIYETRTNIVQKRWNITVGAQVGYGITPVGRQPYAGFGVTFGYSF